MCEERGPLGVAGVGDDLVVDPCQPRVGLNGPQQRHVQSSDSEDLGLGGGELLVGEHTLGVELRVLLELAVGSSSRRRRGGRRVLRLRGVLLLLFVRLLVLFILPLRLTALDPPGHGGGGSRDNGRAGCHTEKSHAFLSISK